MDKTLRSIFWVLIILVVLSSYSTGWFFMAKEKLYNEYVNLESMFESTVENLKEELTATNKENIELRTKLEVIEKKLKVMEFKNKDIQQQYKGLLKQKEDMDKELVKINNDKFILEKKIEDMESGEFIAALIKEKVSLGVELKRLREESKKFSNLKEEGELLEQKVKDSTEVADILSRDLLKEKDKNRINKQELDKLLADRGDLQLKLSGMEREIENKRQEIDKLRFALGYKSQGNEELRAEAYHGPDEVELPPIVLQRDSTKVARLTTPSLERIVKNPVLKGRIVNVNREHNFVVIDLGRQDGVQVGTDFDVYRGEDLIGSIETIQTRERIAAADIKEEEKGFLIDIDDVVMKQQ